jgi:hypothetical protein
MELVNK